MTTYDEIQGIYRAEKRSPNSLGAIDNNFYLNALKLIAEVGESHKNEISNIINEIFQMRVNKIVRLATRIGDSSPPENTIPAEKELYDEIIRLLTDYRKKILLNERIEEEISDKRMENLSTEESKTEKVKLLILRQMPSIIGSDLVHYGPFKENDIVEIPEDTARILIEKGIAEEVQAD